MSHSSVWMWTERRFILKLLPGSWILEEWNLPNQPEPLQTFYISFPARATKCAFMFFTFQFFSIAFAVPLHERERERERLEKVPAGRPALGRWGSVSKNSAVAKIRSKYKQRHNPARRTRAFFCWSLARVWKTAFWETMRTESGSVFCGRVFSARYCRCLLRKGLYSCMHGVCFPKS